MRAGNAVLVYLQERLNPVFSPRLNPMYNLGALGYFFIWTLFISGFYLFIFYDVSLGGAYNSVQRLTDGQKYYGGIIRSVHRYASCGLMAVTAIHTLQTFFSDRFRKYRWFVWVSGAIIIPAVWLEGLTGHMMVFDEGAKMALVQFGGWLDAFPLAVEPFSRNFIRGGPISSLIFFVLTYLHIVFPIGIMILLWMHCMRIAKPPINPPKELAVWSGIILLAISILKPAVSGPPADLSALTASPEIDWFYLFPFPLADALSATAPAVWLAVAGVFLLLFLAPWIIRDPAPGADGLAAVGVATVDLANCTGCGQCQKACPFEAISITSRSDGRPYESGVEILADRCASCGLCLPACPFPALAVGPWTQEYLIRRLRALFPNGGAGKTMVFSCMRAVPDAAIYSGAGNLAVLTIPCAGILGAKVIQESLSQGVDGVVVAACVVEDGHYRLSMKKPDTARVEIAGLKRLAFVTVLMSRPLSVLDGIRKAQDEFAVQRNLPR